MSAISTRIRAGLMAWLLLATLGLCGCGGDSAKPASSQTMKSSMTGPLPANALPATGANAPKFESELLVSHNVGGQGSNSHLRTRYENGKPFSAVENYATTIKGGKRTLRFEVRFKEHRDGKDLYEVKSTAGDEKGEQTSTTESNYEGKRLVIFQSDEATLVLQPPEKK